MYEIFMIYTIVRDDYLVLRKVSPVGIEMTFSRDDMI